LPTATIPRASRLSFVLLRLHFERGDGSQFLCYQGLLHLTAPLLLNFLEIQCGIRQELRCTCRVSCKWVDAY
jgi:hypothetical protein